MHRKPIGPTAHGAIDYAFAAMNTLAPTLFGLTGPAKAICYGFAASQGVLNALTDHPLGLKKVVPLRVHGEAETPYVPAILLLPWVTGAFRQRNARLYFGAFFAVAAANYLLTDYNAYEPAAPLPSGQRAAEMLGSVAG
jgi:hypothetical protein